MKLPLVTQIIEVVGPMVAVKYTPPETRVNRQPPAIGLTGGLPLMHHRALSAPVDLSIWKPLRVR
jgi:hypothetical protein